MIPIVTNIMACINVWMYLIKWVWFPSLSFNRSLHPWLYSQPSCSWLHHLTQPYCKTFQILLKCWFQIHDMQIQLLLSLQVCYAMKEKVFLGFYLPVLHTYSIKPFFPQSFACTHLLVSHHNLCELVLNCVITYFSRHWMLRFK